MHSDANATNNTNAYGDCGVRSLVVTGPWQRTADMTFAKRIALHGRTNAEIRFDVLNIFQADACGCDIVTVPFDILSKAIKMYGMDLSDLSLDTVKMFASDAAAAGYKL